MHVPIHLAISWLIGHRLGERRDRRLVTWAGVVPDLDALSLLGGVGPYAMYHHVVAHGVVAAVASTALCTAFARQRLKVLGLSLLAFHVHLVCDLLGSGRDWAITYWWPFSRREYLTPYGWPLSSPQNAVVWLVAVALTLWIAVKRGRTFAEAFLPAGADAAVVAVLRRLVAGKERVGSSE